VSDEVTVLQRPAPCSLEELRALAVPALRRAGVERAIVFGSWARGEADGFSDLDLVVVLQTDLPRAQRGRCLEAVFAALPIAVDALIYTPEEFREGERRGVGVFDALRREGVDLL
jgi:predicted nucleotidyltransferase